MKYIHWFVVIIIIIFHIVFVWFWCPGNTSVIKWMSQIIVLYTKTIVYVRYISNLGS